MPDLARSTSEMLEEMKKTLQEPEGNTSNAKHRQNVALALTTLIKEQITDAPFRQLYIADAGGKKGTTKSAPLLLQLSASMQEMCSFMLGTNCNWAVVPTATITTTLCSPPPAPTSAKKPRGRPPADPAAKAAAALKKKQDAHNKAINDWDAIFEGRQRFLDAGIGDELGQKSLDFLVRAPSRKNPTSGGSGGGGSTSGSGGDFFCVFFSFQILKNYHHHHHHHHRTGLILTKNPVARKDSNFISVVPIVLLSSLCFYCTC